MADVMQVQPYAMIPCYKGFYHGDQTGRNIFIPQQGLCGPNGMADIGNTSSPSFKWDGIRNVEKARKVGVCRKYFVVFFCHTHLQF